MLPDSVSFIQESPVRVILTELRSGVPVKYRGGSHVNGLLTMCTVLMSRMVKLFMRRSCSI